MERTDEEREGAGAGGREDIAELRARTEALCRLEAPLTVTAGHVDLGPGIWLSTDPAGRAVMSCQAAGEGFVLRLEQGESGAWACLGMRFAPRMLAGARRLGLLAALRGGDMISFTPTLRYFLPDGLHDEPAAEPVFLTGSGREVLAHVPVDAERLGAATGCEFNLFFHDDAFTAEFARLEPLLIV